MIQRSVTGAQEVEAELRTPAATAQLVRYEFYAPPDSRLKEPRTFRIDMFLTARPASTGARFKDLWRQNRFEQVGDIFVLPPDLELSARSDAAGTLRSLVCRIEPEPLLSLFDRLPALNE